MYIHNNSITYNVFPLCFVWSAALHWLQSSGRPACASACRKEVKASFPCVYIHIYIYIYMYTDIYIYIYIYSMCIYPERLNDAHR